MKAVLCDPLRDFSLLPHPEIYYASSQKILVSSIVPLTIANLNTKHQKKRKHKKSDFQVNQNPVYQIYATFIAFYGPTCIMVILYAKMWLAAKRLTDRDRMIAVGTNGSTSGTSQVESLTPHDPYHQNYHHYRYHRPSATLQKIPLVGFFISIAASILTTCRKNQC